MKIFAALLLSMSFIIRCSANHLYGGELYYTHISGLNYKVTLTIYGDCKTDNINGLNELFTDAPEIEIRQGQNILTKIQLQIEGIAGEEITPVCPQEINNTGCNGGSLPGIRKFIYSTQTNLPEARNDWNFVFAGNLGGNVAAGRSSNLTNIVQGSVQQLYLVAYLNNAIAANSSPVFTTIPTPFYCVNLEQSYNQGAVDPDNDSLSFNLIDALTNGGTVAYMPGYSGGKPLAANQFSFDAISGQMIFTPNISQNSLVVNQVQEYRNGILVGSSIREMSFIVLGNCQNTPPTNTIDTTSIIGGIVRPGNIIYTCAGTPMLRFHSDVKDPDGDNLTVTVNGLPNSANLQINNNHLPDPALDFSWNTSNVPAGIYNFYVNIKDDHCPLNSSQTISYTIKIIPLPVVTIDNKPQTICIGEKIILHYSGADQYQWLPADQINYDPDSGLFVRIYQPATYMVIGTSEYGCVDTATLSFTDVRPCCTFSYPDAFTPNEDMHNDKWKPVMYGNHEYYELSIYNRWGQRLFHSFIPNEGWNGNYQGQPCAMDTYYYLIKAKCIQGRIEEHKGSFTLLR